MGVIVHGWDYVTDLCGIVVCVLTGRALNNMGIKSYINF